MFPRVLDFLSEPLAFSATRPQDGGGTEVVRGAVYPCWLYGGVLGFGGGNDEVFVAVRAT
jgi:hypothetical protein